MKKIMKKSKLEERTVWLRPYFFIMDNKKLKYLARRNLCLRQLEVAIDCLEAMIEAQESNELNNLKKDIEKWYKYLINLK